MKIRLIAVGKMKRKAFAELAEEYSRRIQKMMPFEVVEIKDEPILPKADIERALVKEAQRVQKILRHDSYLIILDEKGIQWSSVDLAWEMGQLVRGPAREIVFLVGGAYGIAESLKKEARVRLSLSKLTLPHQLARVLALEQVYRALTILKNVPYHHE